MFCCYCCCWYWLSFHLQLFSNEVSHLEGSNERTNEQSKREKKKQTFKSMQIITMYCYSSSVIIRASKHAFNGNVIAVDSVRFNTHTNAHCHDLWTKKKNIGHLIVCVYGQSTVDNRSFSFYVFIQTNKQTNEHMSRAHNSLTEWAVIGSGFTSYSHTFNTHSATCPFTTQPRHVLHTTQTDNVDLVVTHKHTPSLFKKHTHTTKPERKKTTTDRQTIWVFVRSGLIVNWKF